MRIIKAATDENGNSITLKELGRQYYKQVVGTRKYGTLKIAVDAIQRLAGNDPDEIDFLKYIRQDISRLFVGDPSEIKLMTLMSIRSGHIFL